MRRLQKLSDAAAMQEQCGPRQQHLQGQHRHNITCLTGSSSLTRTLTVTSTVTLTLILQGVTGVRTRIEIS